MKKTLAGQKIAKDTSNTGLISNLQRTLESQQ
jgi:hypothetical protein